MCRKIIRKINDFGATGVPKSIKFSFPKLKFSFPKPGGTKVSRADTFWPAFDATWAILGVIWCTAGRQGDPKIDSFGTRVRPNLEK